MPCFRRVVPPTLPHAADPSAREARQTELAHNQALFIYEAPPTIPGISFLRGPVDRLPDQMPTPWWFVKSGFLLARAQLNFSRFTPSALLDVLATFFKSLFIDTNDSTAVDNALSEYGAKRVLANSTSVEQLRDQVRKRFRQAQKSGSQFEELNPSLEAYRSMFRVISMPLIGNVFLEDRTFARLRIAGYNPISLFRVGSTIPFHIDDARMPASDSVTAAIADRRMYTLDFSALATLKQKTSSSNQLVIPSKALFVVPPGGGDLAAVAIELPDGVVYPPTLEEPFDTRWSIAKMIVNNCDAVHHELIAHLGRTHLLVQPFVAATMRQLPSVHPIHQLLKPHLEGTFFINYTASQNLVAPGGDVDKVFAGDISNVMQWCASQVINNKFNTCMPDVEIPARGVDDSILHFPYREDALEHFDALFEWVFTYVSHFYHSDADVIADMELEKWVEELVDPSRGMLKDFGDKGKGKIRTVRYLARALTFVIFSGSVQHAAVNFPQMTLMSYAPAVAGAIWGELPKVEESAGLSKWESMLTPLETAMSQVEILSVIGALYYTKLGSYRRGALTKETAITTALATYKQRLAKIDARIKKREAGNDLKYEYLRPGNVPQSVNI